MKRDNLMIWAVALAALTCAGLTARAQDDPNQPSTQSTQSSGMTTQKDARTAVSSWPVKTKTAAQALIQKYGQPDTVSDKMLAWDDKGDWKRVAVYREAFKSALGLAHDNFIENTISYTVPANKTSELKKFDKTLVIDRANGTIASRGDSEKANTLALNLANEIVTGQRDVASAKSFMGKTKTEALAGKSSPYMEKLMFTPSGESPSGAPAQPEQPQQTTPPSGY